MTTINIQQELEEQYFRCKNAQDAVFMSVSDGSSFQGAASFISATTNALKELAKLETDLYNAERMKEFERAVIAVMQRAPNSEWLLEELEKEMTYLVGVNK